MQNFREYYEVGTKAYTDHTKKMTPGQRKAVMASHCNSEDKDPNEYDKEGDMAKGQLETIADAALELAGMLEDDTNMPEWVQNKITKAADYIDTARDYMKNELKEGTGKYKGETWEQGYKRRVVKTSDPEHKEKGYKWRIKGKERPEISIKLYKEKPSQAQYNKQMRRVAGHEFGG